MDRYPPNAPSRPALHPPPPPLSPPHSHPPSLLAPDPQKGVARRAGLPLEGPPGGVPGASPLLCLSPRSGRVRGGGPSRGRPARRAATHRDRSLCCSPPLPFAAPRRYFGVGGITT